MTPAQKLKMGRAIAKDIGERYRFTMSGKKEATLSEVLLHKKSTCGEGLDAFLEWSNPMFKQFNKISVLTLLVEKGAIKEKDFAEWMGKEQELLQNKEIMRNLAKSKIELDPEDMDLLQKMFGHTKKIQPANLVFFLSSLKERGKISQTHAEILSKVEELENKQAVIEESIEDSKRRFLTQIEETWRSGKLKHALMNHTQEKRKRKTTLARAVPINQVYPEKRKQKLTESNYERKDIKGLETFTFKQFQALHFLAHKAQNQTDDEKEALEAYQKIGGAEYKDFRTIAYKESEYITNAQGKDHSLASTRERKACLSAIKEVEGVKFLIRWENKNPPKKEEKYIIYEHEIMRKLTLGNPLSIVEKKEHYEKIRNFHFIAIPERIFEYKIMKKSVGYKGEKALFDVVNIDPEFFTKLKYSDPEIQHISDAFMKLTLLFIIEGSYGNKEFVIDEEKLLKRIGLIDANRRKGRAIKTLDTYIEKLINHKTLESIEKKGNQRIFKLPSKESKD